MRYVIGIDEVGRGALAGPVVVAAVCLPKGLEIRNGKLGKLQDSKKLTSQKRVLWFDYFVRYPALCYSIARVYPRRIEKMNISKAANLAALRAFTRLVSDFQLPVQNCRVFLDGGLYLGNGRGFIHMKTWIDADNIRANRPGNPRISARTVVRGDEKIKAIAAASIIAKVSRDGYMRKLAKKHPDYGFEIHKGYGTRHHLRAIGKHGPSSAHRLTFLH